MKWPEHMPWPVWRVWLSGKATLLELEQWNIFDVMDANEALDVKEDAEIIAGEET